MLHRQSSDHNKTRIIFQNEKTIFCPHFHRFPRIDRVRSTSFSSLHLTNASFSFRAPGNLPSNRRTFIKKIKTFSTNMFFNVYKEILINQPNFSRIYSICCLPIPISSTSKTTCHQRRVDAQKRSSKEIQENLWVETIQIDSKSILQ